MASDPAAAQNRRLAPADRRAQLVAAGLDLLRDSTLDTITAPVVAKAAGVSKGLVFHYFPTQRDLQVAIAAAAADEIVAIVRSTDTDADYATQLRIGIDRFVAYIEQYPRSYAAISRDSASDGAMREVFENARNEIVEIVCGAIGLPEVTPLARFYLRGWIALVEESAVQWELHHAVSRETLVDYLQAAVFELGLRSSAPRRAVS